MKANTDGLTMNQLAERNAEHVATIAALESRCAALSAKLSMINDLMEAAEQANKLAQEATEKLIQERNTLAAENAGLKDALNDILQPDAAALERNHRVRALDAMETPATDAFLAELRADARNELLTAFSNSIKRAGLTDGDSVTIFEARDALKHCVEQLNEGDAQ
ncbi:TPA: hypothetical protein R4A09_000920 [Salmonella enterica subsp. enterica serovar Kiambu]|nr:hypothetical protein [Salmonella enterica subsp. enterica serovar Kiambu]HEC7702209.1 hypothetical protein [Salmonella enterica subsp. enterica serovar Kiambu]HEC9183874.1 hypothetical protein [Salmonella enterica subsp. enterica serovar Kiambu]